MRAAYLSKRLSKKSEIIFEDCLMFVQKTKYETWKMKNIPEIVEYYNNECASN
jgi:hypothetical protein